MNQKDKRNFQAKPIKLLGDPILRKVSNPVNDFFNAQFIENAGALHATLVEFRQRYGFGRGISAPQVGVNQRFIALNLGTNPQLIINPVVTRISQNKFTMWDDCMSFPGLLVRLERYESISIRFQNENGEYQEWNNLDLATSELLQHEIDHLDGILAVDRAIDQNSIIMREYFDENREVVNRQVDYTIY
ncbi:MAG: peptide deformylase [Acidobacteria bacterium]|nr:peptide deformylase [Acidobacteriota bacterium]